MIGPGWMPSRPRPISRMRRGFAPVLRRVRRARSQAPSAGPDAGTTIDAAGLTDAPAGPFAERKAKLPVATLMLRRTDGRPAVISGALQRWAEHRWMWVRPRAIPLMVAAMGLVGVLNARRYLISLARGNEPQAVIINGVVVEEPGTPNLPAVIHELGNELTSPRR